MPITPDRARRDLQRGDDLLLGQSTEMMQLDHLGLARSSEGSLLRLVGFLAITALPFNDWFLNRRGFRDSYRWLPSWRPNFRKYELLIRGLAVAARTCLPTTS